MEDDLQWKTAFNGIKLRWKTTFNFDKNIYVKVFRSLNINKVTLSCYKILTEKINFMDMNMVSISFQKILTEIEFN